MDALNSLFYMILFVQPVQQSVAFLLTLIVVLGVRRRWNWSYIPLAIAISSGCILLFTLVMAGMNQIYPLWIITEVVLLLFGFLAYKADTRLHWRSLPLAALIYFFAYNQFTFVRKPLLKDLEWSVEVPSPELTVVKVYLDPEKKMYWIVPNPKLADYLQKRGLPTASAQLDSMYHWGRLAGTSLDFVAGQDISSLSGISLGCDGHCESIEPFPRYYWGLRGLR